ncbi:MAG: hypothetical protein JSV62_01985 [Promethearchaeota archaeon]|nr:MAG: hypothetical protein JSV62_01985 [Candidatus Lokiarchaeota archaeon]
MNIYKKLRKKSRNKIKCLGFLLVGFILPAIFNSPLLGIFLRDIGDTYHDYIDEDPIEKLSLSTPSYSLPNAHYFNYYKVITIDHTKVNGSGYHSNFPVLISITDSDLQDKAQSGGGDIAFANNTSWLDHEIEQYNQNYSPTHAQLIAWVRIPLLSTSIDTTIFMFYGNSTIGNQENPTGVWDPNYKGVWHLNDDPGYGGSIQDSTVNQNDGTAINMESTDQILGQIDGSLRFNGFNEYVSVGNVGTEIRTIEFWMNADTVGSINSYDTGYHSPTANGDDYDQWYNPPGAYYNDGNRASEQTNYEDQDWYNFGFNIPAEAIIEGIIVSIEGSSSVFGQYVSCRVRLSWDGGNSYTYYKTPQSWSSTSDYYRQVGSSIDTWGRSWSASDFSNSNFRVWLEKTGSYSAALRVDHIRIIVYYNIPSDTALIDFDGTDQLSIDADNEEIKPLSFPGTTDVYVNGIAGSAISTGQWYHVAITDTTGVSASALDIARNSTEYYDGAIDEFRLSNIVRSIEWIATEYNNQKDPSNFFSIGVERTPFTDLQVNAIDPYDNPVPNVNISIYKNNNLIKTSIADSNGILVFNNFISIEDKFNFTVSMTSNYEPYHTVIINKTAKAILIEGAFQTINLICNVSRNIFNVVDVDGITVDSGWIIVGNSSDSIQNCSINNLGEATFQWLDVTPYEYNYTVWYRDPNYNQKKIKVASGNIFTPNSDIIVMAMLTTVNFTVLTQDESQFVSGVNLKLNNSNTGEPIVNFVTGLDGKVTFRWLNSSGINSNYTLSVDFYGEPWQFEIINLTSGLVYDVDFPIESKTAYIVKIPIVSGELEEFKTQLISLNPTDTIIIEMGSILKLRVLFNVTDVPSGFGYEDLLGPSYADLMSYQVIEGATTIHSGIFIEEDHYLGTHQVEIETEILECNKIYIIRINAYKSEYVLPQDLTMSLYIIENELILNQSQNDDSPKVVYWEEDINMSSTAYGKISEDFTIKYEINNTIDSTTFKFSIPDILCDWNLSQIVFNIYNISWNVLSEDDINITIAMDDYGIFEVFNTSNHLGYNYNQGTWKGIWLQINKKSFTGDNNFEFNIGGTFDGTLDVLADLVFIRDKINVQYSRFNITNAISLLSEVEGWAIKNITFDIYNCYNISNWNLMDPLNDINLNISIDEEIKYALDSGGLGYGSLTIDDRIIYPFSNQFLFAVESNPEIMFDVSIKVEYIQEFYKNPYLETLNLTIIERDTLGTFQVSIDDNGWTEDQSTLFINEISDGIDYFLPSDLAMTITIGGQTYSISDVLLGQGIFSLDGLTKDTVYSAVINTNQPTLFSLDFIIDYSRTEIYETKGIVSYSVLENPAISGTVQYCEDLECYLQLINTSLLNSYEYTVRFTINKQHYISATKDLNLIVLDRLTMLNGTSGFFRKIENIYVNEAVNFTFLYSDVMKGTNIVDLTAAYYIWEKYDSEGNVIASGQGNLIPTIDNLYILDMDTENLTIGEYLLIVTVGKNNYEYKNAMISLTVNKRIIDYLLNDGINQINVNQGEIAVLRLELTDRTRGSIPLQNATVLLTIMGNVYEIEEVEPGIYFLNFPTENIDTFFASKTFTGKINITKENYNPEELSITIVVGMKEIFPGMPMFYFLLIVFGTLAIGGSIVAYRTYKHAKIPIFVKKVKEMRKNIAGEKSISESLLYSSKEVFVGEIINSKWESLGLSLEEILNIKFEKEKKEIKIKKKISEIVRTHDQKPRGLLFMKWDEKIGTEILVKYPEDLKVSEKTLMQVYSTHEYTGEKGSITLMAESLNILSYYTGSELGYYLLLFLNIDDDPDVYEGGMADILRNILENLKDDSYLHIIPILFQRLSVFPSLTDEEILTLHYQNEVKRLIINILRDDGVITKSELEIWLRDKHLGGFFDIDVILNDLIKLDIIKVGSIKGMPSELIFLINDIFMIRVPPVRLLEDPISKGLPTQLAKTYQNEVKKFFQEYIPTEDDIVQVVNILINPQVYEALRLLRTRICTAEDLEKLKKKGVDDIYNVLKLLWDSQMINVFHDEKNIEYYALLSDFYADFIFPKYLLKRIKIAYEQKSKVNKVLIEYLHILENTYNNLKSQKK